MKRKTITTILLTLFLASMLSIRPVVAEEKILLGKITHKDGISKVNAAVKYTIVDGKLVLEFQTVYFVKENHVVQFLGYFIVPLFFDYPYTILNAWGKTFKPGAGGYTGTVVPQIYEGEPGTIGPMFLQRGDQWCGIAPTGIYEDAMIQADVDQLDFTDPYWASLEAGMKIVIHQTIELPDTYSGSIDFCVRGNSACGGPHWEARYTIGTL